MKNKLEQLLNSLIEKGWKPFGIKSDEFYIYISKFFQIVISYYRLDLYGDKERNEKRYSYRELVSKESGLWQFVCENAMIKTPDKYWKRYRELTISDGIVCMSGEYEYRIIESALKDESKLEDFLLNSIKLD